MACLCVGMLIRACAVCDALHDPRTHVCSTIPAAKCRQRGACIHFTVMDHDLLLSNDFAGEAFLSLSDIPGISGEEISGFSALTPISLTLTHPKRVTSKPLLTKVHQ